MVPFLPKISERVKFPSSSKQDYTLDETPTAAWSKDLDSLRGQENQDFTWLPF